MIAALMVTGGSLAVTAGLLGIPALLILAIVIALVISFGARIWQGGVRFRAQLLGLLLFTGFGLYVSAGYFVGGSADYIIGATLGLVSVTSFAVMVGLAIEARRLRAQDEAPPDEDRSLS